MQNYLLWTVNPNPGNRAFERIAPLLWMRAGSEGSRIDKLPTSGWGVVRRVTSAKEAYLNPASAAYGS